jgi:hypothetical protein
MVTHWFRMYHEFATDPKVQMMPEAMQRRLVMLFCARCSDVLVTFRERELAFFMRVTLPELAETKALFIEQGFIDEDWNLCNWERRQMASDSSTDRTRRYRERMRTSQKRHGDADVTGGDTKSVTPVTKRDALEERRGEEKRREQRKIYIRAGARPILKQSETSPKRHRNVARSRELVSNPRRALARLSRARSQMATCPSPSSKSLSCLDLSLTKARAV